MNNLKPTPIGIDRAISQLQVPLYEALNALTGDITGFGRVYKNKTDKGYDLEAYVKDGDYSKNVLDGDRSRFFFYLNEEMEGDTDLKARVDIVFMVNLKDLFGISERKDEEFRAIVSECIQGSRFNQIKTIIGADHILRLISNGYDKTNLVFNDMHPYHAVTFQTEVNYKLKTC